MEVSVQLGYTNLQLGRDQKMVTKNVIEKRHCWPDIADHEQRFGCAGS